MRGGKSFKKINKGIEIVFKNCGFNKVLVDVDKSMIIVVRNNKKTQLEFNGESDSHVQYVQEFVKIFKSVINYDKNPFFYFEEIKYM